MNVDSVNGMNVDAINSCLFAGEIDRPGLFPKLEALRAQPIQFEFNFGLQKLPKEPGLIIIRGPRQYGKSTWIESQIYSHIQEHGPGSALYLNGDEIKDHTELLEKCRKTISAFSKNAKYKTLFIDEICAVNGWEKAIKILSDRGESNHVLIVTTGSRATDLKRGHERLPGRKGRLERTNYLFVPISFQEFDQKARTVFKENSIFAYLISGGSPVACLELIQNKKIPEHVIHMTRDWVIGECSRSGRDRGNLLAVFESLFAYGGAPVGNTKLAKEVGLANNTVASGYIQLLRDLMCVGVCHNIDPNNYRPNYKKPAKFHFINTLVATAFSRDHIRSVEDFLNISPEDQGKWLEWLVAQEIYRRSAIAGIEDPDTFIFWNNGSHEIDFIDKEKKTCFEVKRGQATPFEFSWFQKIFPKNKLIVLAQSEFETENIQGKTIAAWCRTN